MRAHGCVSTSRIACAPEARFGACTGLENGAGLVGKGDAWTDMGSPGSVLDLTARWRAHDAVRRLARHPCRPGAGRRTAACLRQSMRSPSWRGRRRPSSSGMVGRGCGKMLHRVQGLGCRPSTGWGDRPSFNLDSVNGRVVKFEVHRGGNRHWVRDPTTTGWHGTRLVRTPSARCPGTMAALGRARAGMREGSLEGFTLDSAVWGGPADHGLSSNEYKAHKVYPLLICHDGADYLRFAGIKTVLDNLISRKEMLPTIGLRPARAPERRIRRQPQPGRVPCRRTAPCHRVAVPGLAGPFERALMGANSRWRLLPVHRVESPVSVFGRLLLQSGRLVFTMSDTTGAVPRIRWWTS